MKKLRMYLFFMTLFFLLSVSLFGCSSSNKGGNKNESKISNKKVHYNTLDYTLEKTINTELGNFMYLKTNDNLKGDFVILEMEKSKFDVNKIREFAENKTIFRDDNSLQSLNIAFDDNTGMEINRGDGDSEEVELEGSFVIFYSNLTPEYIDFLNKYKNFDNGRETYALPNDEISFLSNNKDQEFLFYSNGIFTTQKSHFPVKKGSILEPLIR